MVSPTWQTKRTGTNIDTLILRSASKRNWRKKRRSKKASNAQLFTHAGKPQNKDVILSARLHVQVRLHNINYRAKKSCVCLCEGNYNLWIITSTTLPCTYPTRNVCKSENYKLRSITLLWVQQSVCRRWATRTVLTATPSALPSMVLGLNLHPNSYS